MTRVERPEAYHRAGSWALERLETHLGTDWPQRAAARNEELPLALHRLGSHPMALAQALDWALALTELAALPGFADVLADLRDVRAARTLHTELQLLVAAHAQRLGHAVRLEPSVPGATRPADVAITADNGHELIIETRVLTESDRSRARREAIDDLMDRLRAMAWSRGTWLSGTVSRLLSDVELRLIDDWICDQSVDVGAREPLSLELPHISLRLSPRDAPIGRLTSPPLDEALLPRMSRAIQDKAALMSESRALWLRIVPLTGIWPLTPWGVSPLRDKLSLIHDALAASGNTPPGIVLSSAAGRYDGTVDEETVRLDPRAAAVRRAVSPGRARETLVIAFSTHPAEVDTWIALADAERDWLPWAMGRHGLPSWAEIVGAPYSPPSRR